MRYRETTKFTLLYATDTSFVEKAGRVYSMGPFSNSYWGKYLEVFERVQVVGRVDVSHPKRNGALDQISSGDQVEFELFPSLSSLTGLIWRRRAVRQRIRELVESADLVLARLHSEFGLLAVEQARLMRKPWAVEVASCAFDCLWHYGDLRGKLYAPIMYWRTRDAVRRAPVAIYVTKEFLQKRYPKRTGVTLAVSDVNVLPPDPKVLERRKKRIALGEKYRVGLIGSLGPRYKGIQTVFQALQNWPTAMPDVEFNILGSGSVEYWSREAQRFGITKKVIFSPALPHGEAVMNWLDNIDIYVQPSLAEGLPRSLIEAMTRGCPAIASCVGGIPELLGPANLISAGDATGLRRKLINAISDKGWQLEQAEKNWRKTGNYSQEKLNLARHEALIRCRSLID
jgi:glycosyltransferase involved in cell wall biosynthesis